MVLLFSVQSLAGKYLSDLRANGIAAVIDPGCYSQEEQQELRSFMEAQSLQPLHLPLNTLPYRSCVGKCFWADTWQLDLAMHQERSGAERQ